MLSNHQTGIVEIAAELSISFGCVFSSFMRRQHIKRCVQDRCHVAWHLYWKTHVLACELNLQCFEEKDQILFWVAWSPWMIPGCIQSWVVPFWYPSHHGSIACSHWLEKLCWLFSGSTEEFCSNIACSQELLSLELQWSAGTLFKTSCVVEMSWFACE